MVSAPQRSAQSSFSSSSSVPELTDLSDEPDSVFERYGPDSRTPGTFAANEAPMFALILVAEARPMHIGSS